MKEYICKNCGMPFLGNPPAKYCYECRPKVKRKRDTKSLYERRKARKFAEQHKLTLDEKIALCRTQGISYAQQQIQDTLKRISSCE